MNSSLSTPCVNWSDQSLQFEPHSVPSVIDCIRRLKYCAKHSFIERHATEKVALVAWAELILLGSFQQDGILRDRRNELCHRSEGHLLLLGGGSITQAGVKARHKAINCGINRSVVTTSGWDVELRALKRWRLGDCAHLRKWILTGFNLKTCKSLSLSPSSP